MIHFSVYFVFLIVQIVSLTVMASHFLSLTGKSSLEAQQCSQVTFHTIRLFIHHKYHDIEME